MNAFLDRLNRWNIRMNGLPRKGMLIAVTLLLAWLLILVAPLCWPFLLAMLFAMALEPLVRLLTQGLRRLRVPRWLATALGMVLLFGVLGVGAYALARRLVQELISLAYATPGFVRWFTATTVPALQGLYRQYSDVLPTTVMTVVNNGLSALGDSLINLAGTLSASLTSGAVRFTTSIPGMLLSVVLTIMGTFYMTADRERILAFFRRTFPTEVQTHGNMLKRNLFRALFGQVKSQLTVSLIITTFLVLSFVLYGVRYGLLLGVLIGVGDALPVIGAGLFLIPWAIVNLLMGQYATGAFLAAVYVGTIVIRQISEPRIVGANLGLYPLATMVAIFAGYRLFGFLGLLGGPILLNLLKVVLEADDIARGLKPMPLRTRGRRRGGDAPAPEPSADDAAAGMMQAEGDAVRAAADTDDGGASPVQGSATVDGQAQNDGGEPADDL